jgi:hypothetical protein
MRSRRLTGLPGSSESRGVTYYLPRTVVKANVPVVRTRWRPGRHSDLLPYFFPCLENTAGADPRPDAPPSCGEQGKPYTAAVTSFELDDPVIQTGPERDPDQMFSVDYKSKWFQWFVDRKFGLDLTEDGIASTVSAEASDRTGEVIGQVLKSAASIYLKAAVPGAFEGFLPLKAVPSDEVRRISPCSRLNPPITERQGKFAESLPDADKTFFLRTALCGPRRIHRHAVTTTVEFPVVPADDGAIHRRSKPKASALSQRMGCLEANCRRA